MHYRRLSLERPEQGIWNPGATSLRLLLTAGLFQFVTYACFFNLTPLYPQVGHDLGLDAGTLGALVGIGGAVAVVLQVPAGSGGDAWGRRPFFGAAMLLLVLGQIARWQAQDATALLVGQILAGAALGTAGVTGWALVADLGKADPGRSISKTDGGRRVGTANGGGRAGKADVGRVGRADDGGRLGRSHGRKVDGRGRVDEADGGGRLGRADGGGRRAGQGQAFGVLTASLSLGLVGGYLFAGLVGGTVGWRTESLVLAVLPLLGLALVPSIPGRRRPSPAASGAGPGSSGSGVAAAAGSASGPGPDPGLGAGRGAGSGSGSDAGSGAAGPGVVLRALANRRRLALAGVAALTLSAGQGAIYLLPFGLSQRDLGPQAAALLLMPYVVGSVVAAPLGGRLGDRFGPRRVIVTGLLLGLVTCLSLVWLADSTPLLVVCFILIGAAVNGSLPQVAVRVVRLGDTAGAGMGTIMAGLRMGQSLGSFLGPLLAGFVLVRVGLDAGWVAQAALLLAALALHELGSK